MKKLMIFLLSISLNQTPILADQDWDDLRFQGLKPGKSYEINIGSGFFVNDDTIITNRHVVSKCKNIAIRGSVPPQLATLLLVDNDVDLAILKVNSSIPPRRVAYFRDNFDSLKTGDIIFSVGYPLAAGDSGIFVIHDAKVISINNYAKTKFTQIEFTDSANHGNSGGPLVDKNSNLIGVVTAKLTYSDNLPGFNTNSVSMAISLDGLLDFLDKNDISHIRRSTFGIFINYDVKKVVQDYIVNIHCVQDT